MRKKRQRNCVCSHLGGHQDWWVGQLVVAVHPEGEEDDGSDAHYGHQRVHQSGQHLGLLGHRVGSG